MPISNGTSAGSSYDDSELRQLIENLTDRLDGLGDRYENLLDRVDALTGGGGDDEDEQESFGRFVSTTANGPVEVAAGDQLTFTGVRADGQDWALANFSTTFSESASYPSVEAFLALAVNPLLEESNAGFDILTESGVSYVVLFAGVYLYSFHADTTIAGLWVEAFHGAAD